MATRVLVKQEAWAPLGAKGVRDAHQRSLANQQHLESRLWALFEMTRMGPPPMVSWAPAKIEQRAPRGAEGRSGVGQGDQVESKPAAALTPLPSGC